MSHPNKPSIITEIEKILDHPLHLAPERNNDPLGGLMPYKENTPKYALEGTTLIGLNLAKTTLTDEKWQQITQLPDFPNQDIRGLSLSENQLTEFRLLPGMANLERLYIDENPLTFPDEAITKQGNAAILRFLKEIFIQGEKDVYEVKMLIVGEGGTGKTTLWHKLQNPDYPVPQPIDKQPSTVGIEIKEGWTFNHPDHQDTPFLVNLWDFGGQPIQHMTHQFFLTRRSFYVLLADSRRDVANFAYWFKIIDLLGCDPREPEPLPVFVVLNKKGTVNPPLPYDPEDAKRAFPRLNLINYEVDFAKKDFQLNGLPGAIQDILCHQLPHLPLKMPTLWDEVRKELYQLRRTKERDGLDHITLQQFQKICEEQGITDHQQMRDLSQLLHDLGVILHHQDDAQLQNFIVLNPEWALNAVYEILKHEEVGNNQGRFDEQFLAEVWNAAGYKPDEQYHLKGLMLKDSFEVCFLAEEDGRSIYIAPQLLPDYRPKFDWEPGNEALRYTFQYPFMPKGLIGRLIVRLNENLKSSAEGKKIVWVKGMLLRDGKCEALVIETKDDTTGGQIIQIEVKGSNAEDRRFLLRTIRTELDKIHRRSFPSLRYFEKIPCCCKDCLTSGAPMFYDLLDLERRKAKGKGTVECSRSFEDVSVEALMLGVYGFEQPREIHPIKQVIAQGRLKEGLDKLLLVVPEGKQNVILGLQARFSSLEEQIQKGGLDQNELRKERSQIIDAALGLCDEIDG